MSILFIMDLFCWLMTILFSSSHFKRQIYRKNDKNEQEKHKKKVCYKKNNDNDFIFKIYS